jgi:FkbM family methyltransferase
MARGHRILKVIVLTLVAADLLVVLAWKTPGRVLALSAVGRSNCSLGGTYDSFSASRRHFDLLRQFRQSIRVVQRDAAAGLELWDTPAGQIWTAANDQILPVLLVEQHEQIYGSGDRAVHPGDVVLDCGANIGMFSRTAIASGARLVVAIEPAPQTLACLRRNMAKEIADGRVVVYPKGVWDKDAFLDLTVDDLNAGSNSLVLAPGHKSTVRVPLTTIDQIVQELHLARVDFIKMDIEGAEKMALAGARQTIQHFRPRMAISSEHLADDTTKIPAEVSRIRPDYRLEFADCEDEGDRVQPLVIQFF